MIQKVIVSGGGTGGHIFPAISIAKSLEKKVKFIELLFVGSKDRMEMQKQLKIQDLIQKYQK